MPDCWTIGNGVTQPTRAGPCPSVPSQSPARITRRPAIGVTRYHPLLVALHWLLAFLIIAALALGALVMARIPNSDPMKLEALRSHMIGGALIFLLMVLRLGVRIRTDRPRDASTGSAALDRLAWWSHRLLYAAVLAMALSGMIMALQTRLPWILFGHEGNLPPSFWVFPIRTVHYLLSRILIALIALHIAGAFYHIVVRRDHLLRRMFFGHCHTQDSESVLPNPEGVPAS
jgi:cytochrome b561